MVVDFHSHILPHVDDGSRSLEDSLQMLRMEARQGVDHVILTPHFYPQQDSPERFLERRAKAWKRLKAAMAKEEGLPKVSLGAEVYFYNGMSQSEALYQLTIEEKRCILLEMPHAPWTESMFQEIAAIKSRLGLTPIIAHIDRYVAPFRTFRIPERLEELPVYVQANGDFFLRKSTAKMALRMLKRGQIHLLGSDCHDKISRNPNLEDALKVISERLGDEAVAFIRDCQDRVLSL